MSVDDQIAEFLKSPAFAVAGVSKKPDKFGYKVFKCYQHKGYRVIPIHPVETDIDGVACVANVAELPAEVVSLSVVTPPAVTEKIVISAAQKGIRNIWMQPGAQSPAAIAFCEEQGINVIADGTCALVRFGCKH